MQPPTYQARDFHLSGLHGISDKTLEMHHKLYEGYVTATNALNEHIAAILEDGNVDQEEMPAYSELTRRLGFEYNGMVLHELYFENLTSHQSSDMQDQNAIERAITKSFGSFEVWKMDFTSIGRMRGVGWAICYQNPQNNLLSNHWVSLHEYGNVAGFKPVLVMDVWEHAYLLDSQPSERGKYIESFLSNVDWNVVTNRLAHPVNGSADPPQ